MLYFSRRGVMMDIEQTIAFLLEQQSQFVTDMSELRAVVLDIASSLARTNEIVSTLAERHVALAESHKELTEQHKATEAALHVLISTVERHIAGHN
jgi:hypothetical protein